MKHEEKYVITIKEDTIFLRSLIATIAKRNKIKVLNVGTHSIHITGTFSSARHMLMELSTFSQLSPTSMKLLRITGDGESLRVKEV